MSEVKGEQLDVLNQEGEGNIPGLFMSLLKSIERGRWSVVKKLADAHPGFRALINPDNPLVWTEGVEGGRGGKGCHP